MMSSKTITMIIKGTRKIIMVVVIINKRVIKNMDQEDYKHYNLILRRKNWSY